MPYSTTIAPQFMDENCLGRACQRGIRERAGLHRYPTSPHRAPRRPVMHTGFYSHVLAVWVRSCNVTYPRRGILSISDKLDRKVVCPAPPFALSTVISSLVNRFHFFVFYLSITNVPGRHVRSFDQTPEYPAPPHTY